MRPGRYVCETCGRDFKKSWKLEEHTAKHTGIRPFKCDFEGCTKDFVRQTHLKRHKLSHSGAKPFVCLVEDCRASFSTNTHLKRHQRLHERPYPFQCSFSGCDKFFAKHLQLRKHQYVHTGVKPFACTYEGCTESFDRQSRLDRHAVVHSGIPRYMCSEGTCKEESNGFTSWTLLNEHIKAVHRPALYQCETCRRSFKERKHWRAHLATHDPNRIRFPCTQPGCTERFVTARNMRRHIEVVHEGQQTTVSDDGSSSSSQEGDSEIDKNQETSESEWAQPSPKRQRAAAKGDEMSILPLCSAAELRLIA